MLLNKSTFLSVVKSLGLYFSLIVFFTIPFIKMDKELFFTYVGPIISVLAALLVFIYGFSANNASLKKFVIDDFKKINTINILLGVTSGVFLALLINSLSAFFFPSNDAAVSPTSLLIVIYSLIFLGVLIPIAEELFIRGFIFKFLQESFRTAIVPYVLSSLVFALIHFEANGFAIWRLASMFTVGFIFAFLYKKTDNILVPITAHITYNVILLTALS